MAVGSNILVQFKFSKWLSTGTGSGFDNTAGSVDDVTSLSGTDDVIGATGSTGRCLLVAKSFEKLTELVDDKI